MPRIALIHATPLAVGPINEAFERAWPSAQRMNLLDDSLSQDRARAGELTAAMVQRFVDLAVYAKGTGADGILFTCSAFGPAIEAAGRAVGIPTLKPNEAMFEQALNVVTPGSTGGRWPKNTGASSTANDPDLRRDDKTVVIPAKAGVAGRRIALGLIATFQASIPSMSEELRAMAAQQGIEIDLHTVHVPHAMDALAAGNADEHHALIASAARTLPPCDAVMLAQFSMAAVRPHVQRELQCPVLSSPDCAVAALRQSLPDA